MPNIIDRRSVCLAVSIFSIDQVGPSKLKTCITPISKERQYADGYQTD
jgi:hypothetical protein